MTRAEQTRHTAAMRGQGMAGYAIHPEGERDYYAPTIFIEPDDERNRLVFGYDMLSDRDYPRPGEEAGMRRAAMEQARDTGMAALSGKIRLLFENGPDAQANFLMFLPVYRYDAPHGTVAERRANIIGWVSSVFRADDLMSGILGNSGTDVDTDIYDGGEMSGRALMYDSDHSGGVDEKGSRFRKVERIEIAGRTWAVAVRSLPAFDAMLDREKSQLIGWGGGAASLLLSLFVWLLVYGRERALRAAREMRESEEKLQTILDNAPSGIWLVGADGRYRFVNKTFCDAVGVSESRFLAASNLADVMDAGAAAACEESDRACLEREAPYVSHETVPFVDGKPHVLEVTKVPLHDAGGKVTGVIGIGSDITERRQAECDLTESRGKLLAIIDTALDAVVQMDAEGIITGWNSQAENIFGWSRDEAVGRALHHTIIPPQFHESHLRGLKRFLDSGEGPMLNTRIEISALHRDGSEFPIELSVAQIKVRDQYEFSAFIRDITKKKQFEDLIWKQANYDALTGLPNRRMFHDRLAQEIKKAHRACRMLALLFIDLDRFKEVNDTLGHTVGDLLLVEAAQRIGACLRETDTVARLGGDEFTVILAELDDACNVERIAENILKKLSDPFRLENEVIYLSASMGITLYPNDATEIEELLKDADQAMYAAKSMGRNRLSYFTPELQQAALARLKLINDLRGALAADQFRVFFQPIADMGSGRISKAEALIRWQHPERGMVSPMDFIPLAEESGLILEIGDWVFRESARWVKRWRDLIHPDFQVSVNKSPVQFYKEEGDHSSWIRHLRDLGLPGDCLVIEITEGLLLDSAKPVTDALYALRDAGIQVAIDDFGTGYSSLSYLKKFDIDYLKIDKSFTSHIAPGSSDMVLSNAIIVMAHQLGFKVIAEGVETEQQRALLAAAGCDYAQGYLYTKPLPPEKFELLLLAYSGMLPAGAGDSKMMWDDKFMTGVGFMDEGHNEMFALIENCIGAIGNHAQKEQQIEYLDKIAAHLFRHFSDEEEAMGSAGEGRFDEHIMQHRHITEKINALISRFRDDGDAISAQDILHVLFDWFVLHNAGEDRKLADYIRGAEARDLQPAAPR